LERLRITIIEFERMFEDEVAVLTYFQLAWDGRLVRH
jgi:hypothetical protein